MHRRFLVLLVLVVLAAVPAFANHSWGGYHWARTSNPFTLKIHDNVDPIWEPYLTTAASDWAQSTVLNLTVLWQQPLTSQRKCGSTTGQIEVCNTKYGFNGWLGIAGISVTGGVHITKGYEKMNDSYYTQAQYNTPAWRQMVMCQEIGHTFGLDHQDENFDNPNLGTCMDYTNNPSTNQHPNQHDYQELQDIYAHLDSFNSYTAVFNSMEMSARMPKTIDEILSADTDDLGVPVRWDKGGRPDVFVKPVAFSQDKGADIDVVHIFWIPPGMPRD